MFIPIKGLLWVLPPFIWHQQIIWIKKTFRLEIFYDSMFLYFLHIFGTFFHFIHFNGRNRHWQIHQRFLAITVILNYLFLIVSGMKIRNYFLDINIWIGKFIFSSLLWQHSFLPSFFFALLIKKRPMHQSRCN